MRSSQKFRYEMFGVMVWNSEKVRKQGEISKMNNAPEDDLQSPLIGVGDVDALLTAKKQEIIGKAVSLSIENLFAWISHPCSYHHGWK